MLGKFKEALSQKGEIYLRLKILPGADKSEVREVLEDKTIKISIAALAEKGKANQELVKFLAKEFGAPKTGVKIISGAGERLKLVKISF